MANAITSAKTWLDEKYQIKKQDETHPVFCASLLT